MATEAPVLLIVEIEPTETDYIAVGASVRMHLQIVDADSKQAVDPDAGYPTLTFRAPFTTAVVYNNVSSPAVIKDGTGLYHIDIPITKPGTNRFQWLALMGGVSAGSNTTTIQGVEATYW